VGEKELYPLFLTVLGGNKEGWRGGKTLSPSPDGLGEKRGERLSVSPLAF
jgi:hypothetical protein